MSQKPKKPGARDQPPEFVDAPGAAFLALLPALPLARLAVRCGVASDGDPSARVLAAAATSAVARRLVAELDRDARETLFALYALRYPREPSEVERMLRVVLGRDLPRTRRSIDALKAAGLLVESKDAPPLLVAFPTLGLGLGHDVIVWLAGGAADAPAPTPIVRRLALLLAHLHADPLERTQQYVPAVRWLERAAPIFEPIGFPRQLLVNLVAWLGTVGALDFAVESGGAQSVIVSPQAAALLRSDPEHLALTFAARDDLNPAGSLLATLVALDLARQAGDASPTITDLTKVAERWYAHRVDLGLTYDRERVELRGIAWAVRRLQTLGLAEVARHGDTVTVRRRPAAKLGTTFRCTVLPTFEVLVGADADPGATVDLGRIADLVSADGVARFELTEASLARAARAPGGAEPLIDALAAAAERGLPDGVRATITAWARRARTIRLYEGAVVVAETPEQAAWLRGQREVGLEIAPNVFRVGASSVSGLRAAAAGAQLPIVTEPVVVMPAARTDATGSRFLDVERDAKDVRTRLERWAGPPPARSKAKPTTRPNRPEPSHPKVAPRRRDDRLLASSDSPETFADLRDGWPRIARTASKYPDLIDVALALSEDELDAIEDETTTVEELMTELMAWKREIEGARASAARGPTTATPAEALTAARDAVESMAWTTLPVGALSARLEGAAARGTTVEIAYVNASGVRSERKVVPLGVEHAGRRAWLEARDVAAGSTTRFDLDRIAAVRGT